MQQFSRPQDAREIEARGRARTLGVRVEVVQPTRAYRTRSQSQPGTVYTIQRGTRGWVCTCPGFQYTGCCKHLGQVERRSEREGWEFGTVAPLHRVDRYLPLAMPERGTRGRASVATPSATLVALRPAVSPHTYPAVVYPRTDERQSA